MNIIGSKTSIDGNKRKEWGYILILFGYLICSLCIIIITVSVLEWFNGSEEAKELLTSWGYTYKSLLVGILLIGIGTIVEIKKI